MHKTKQFSIISLLLTIAVCVSLFNISETDSFANTEIPYYYQLMATQDGTKMVDGKAVIDQTGTIELQLYLIHYKGSDTPKMDAGNFALKYPKSLGGVAGANLTFTPGRNVALNEANVETIPIAPAVGNTDSSPPGEDEPETLPSLSNEIKKDTYHAITWRSRSDADYDNGNIPPPLNTAEYRLHIGTYSFDLDNVDNLPSKTTVGQFPWLSASEAEPKIATSSNPDKDPAKDPFNKIVWDVNENLYKGYYLPKVVDPSNEDPLKLKHTPIEFKWGAPTAWPNSSFTILSMDPKKLMKIEIYDDSSGGRPQLPTDTAYIKIWNDTDKDTLTHTSANLEKSNTGIGLYKTSPDLDTLFKNSSGESLSLVTGNTYRLVISKPGSLSVEISGLVATNANLSDSQGLPQEDIYMPSGDISPGEMERLGMEL